MVGNPSSEIIDYAEGNQILVLQTSLAGKLMMVVELFSYRPVAMHYDENDKTFGEWLLTTLPVGSLLVFDLGFFAFPWFDQFTETELEQHPRLLPHCPTLRCLS